MSSTIIKSIKVLKDGTFDMRESGKWAIPDNCWRNLGTTKENHDNFYEYLLGGMIKTIPSANGYKWSYAILHLSGYTEGWCKAWEKVEGDEQKRQWFEDYINDKIPQPKGKYILRLHGAKSPWLVKITPKGAWTNDEKSRAVKYPYRKACVIANLCEERHYGNVFKVDVVPA